MFLFAPQLYLEELSRYAPDIVAKAAEALKQGRRDLDFLRSERDSFAACQSISIDYAVMERTDKAAALRAAAGV